MVSRCCCCNCGSGSGGDKGQRRKKKNRRSHPGSDVDGDKETLLKRTSAGSSFTASSAAPSANFDYEAECDRNLEDEERQGRIIKREEEEEEEKKVAKGGQDDDDEDIIDLTVSRVEQRPTRPRRHLHHHHKQKPVTVRDKYTLDSPPPPALAPPRPRPMAPSRSKSAPNVKHTEEEERAVREEIEAGLIQVDSVQQEQKASVLTTSTDDELRQVHTTCLKHKRKKEKKYREKMLLNIK